jgi:hypothetical protein
LSSDRVGTRRRRRLLALRPELVIFFGPALHASQLSRARPFVMLTLRTNTNDNSPRATTKPADNHAKMTVAPSVEYESA